MGPNKEAFLGLANSYLNLNDLPEAIKYQTLAIENGIGGTSDYQARVYMYMHTKQWDEAIADENYILSYAPSSKAALCGRAKAFYHQGKLDEAMSDIDRVFAISATDLNSLWLAARISLDLNKPNDCIAYCRKAVSINPDYFYAHFLLVKAYAQIGEFQKAFEELKKARATGASKSQFVQGKFFLLLEQNKTTEAIEVIDRFLQTESDCCWARYYKAVALFVRGSYDLAAEEAAKSEKAGSANDEERKYAVFLNFIADKHLSSSDARLMRQCLASAEDKSSWTFAIGQCLLGKLSAQALLERAKTPEQKVEANTYIGFKCLKDRQVNKAKQYFHKAIERGYIDCTEYELAKSQLKS